MSIKQGPLGLVVSRPRVTDQQQLSEQSVHAVTPPMGYGRPRRAPAPRHCECGARGARSVRRAVPLSCVDETQRSVPSVGLGPVRSAVSPARWAPAPRAPPA
eukprot:4615934-Prymnesium_polylepis.1